MPDKAFIGKEIDNNKKNEEEYKRKGNKDDGGNNSGSGAKMGKKMRGGIDRSASNDDN